MPDIRSFLSDTVIRSIPADFTFSQDAEDEQLPVFRYISNPRSLLLLSVQFRTTLPFDPLVAVKPEGLNGMQTV